MSMIYPVSAQLTEFVPGQLCGSNDFGIRLLQYGDESSNRELCLQDCRSRYGGDLYSNSVEQGAELQRRGGFGGGMGTNPGYYQYAQCVNSCENRFWREFDRRMRDLEKE
jgi:hypothetical protein